MGYLFLGFSLLAGITKGYCGKKLGNTTEKTFDAVILNLVRMIFCIIIGLSLIILQGNFTFLLPNTNSLLIMAASGISTSLFVISWLLSVKVGAYMMVEVFVMISVLIPIITSSLLFSETISLNEWIGIALLVIAAYIMCSYNNSQSRKMSAKAFIVLLLCCFSNGLTDLMQKLFVKTAPETPISIFNFYTYVFSTLFLIPLLFVFSKEKMNSKSNNVKSTLLKSIGYIAVMSACLFIYSYFKTAAAGYLDATQLYPLSQGSALILSTVMATLIFKEKLTVKCVLGIATAFAGIIFINILSF